MVWSYMIPPTAEPDWRRGDPPMKMTARTFRKCVRLNCLRAGVLCDSISPRFGNVK